MDLETFQLISYMNPSAESRLFLLLHNLLNRPWWQIFLFLWNSTAREVEMGHLLSVEKVPG